MSNNGTETPQHDDDTALPPYRCQIILTFPWDGNVDIAVDSGGVVELFAAAAFLERTAHKLLASAEREAAAQRIIPVPSMGGLTT